MSVVARLSTPSNPSRRRALRRAAGTAGCLPALLPTLLPLALAGCERARGETEAPRAAGPAPAAPVGVNLSGIAWSSAFPFADLMRSAQAWRLRGDVDGYWGGPPPLDADGWPASLPAGQHAVCAVATEGSGYPAGRYAVRWLGEGALDVPSGQGRFVSLGPGRGEWHVEGDRTPLQLFITRTEPRDPVRAVQVRWPGSADDALFNPLWLERLRPFGTLRFMDWGATNGSPTSTWAERVRPGAAHWTDARGVPVECMVDAANALGADPWFCIPHRADDAYVRRFAALVRERLHPARRVYVEYSNEVWNGGFEQARWALAESRRLRLEAPGGQPALFYARRAGEVLGLVRAAFGEQAGRVVRVLCGQAAWDNFLSQGLQAVSRDRAAAETFDAIAIAPYFDAGGNDPAKLDETLRRTPEQLLDAMLAHLRGPVRDGIAAHARLARRHRLPLLAYEGGAHDTASQMPENRRAALVALQMAAHRHPRMREVYAACLAQWAELGGGLFVHYADIGNWSQHGLWGALERVTQDPAAAPKYEALVAAARAGGRR